MITATALKLLLTYKADGEFTWNTSDGYVKQGCPAGTLRSNGYVQIRLAGKSYRAHILVWLYHTGSYPTQTLDHINRIKHDNRIENLREASLSQQQHNKGIGASNNSGIKGVCYITRGKRWRAFAGGRVLYNGFDLFEACCIRKTWELHHA